MRALVTGATSRGIGGAICMKLARDAIKENIPAHIIACATGKNPGLEELVSDLKAIGANVLPLAGDLSDPEIPEQLIGKAVQFCGGLDALVSNAGHAVPALLTELSLDDWNRLIDVHARAAWLLAKAAYPFLKASKGSMVAIGSINGGFPHVGHGGYSAAKAALNLLCQTLAMEWAADGIRVNIVSPGLIRTGMSEYAYRDQSVTQERESIIPLGRIGRPEDVAGAVAFFLGPDSQFITGENIHIDGGFARSSLNRMARRRGNVFV